MTQFNNRIHYARCTRVQDIIGGLSPKVKRKISIEILEGVTLKKKYIFKFLNQSEKEIDFSDYCKRKE